MGEKVFIAARIDCEIKKLIEKICQARGEDLSDFVRYSIRKELARLSFLPTEDKKALGINLRPVFENQNKDELR